MELRGCDDLGELLHVSWLDVHDVEWLISDLHVPEVDAEVISGEVSLLQQQNRVSNQFRADPGYLALFQESSSINWDFGEGREGEEEDEVIFVCSSSDFQ